MRVVASAREGSEIGHLSMGTSIDEVRWIRTIDATLGFSERRTLSHGQLQSDMDELQVLPDPHLQASPFVVAPGCPHGVQTPPAAQTSSES